MGSTRCSSDMEIERGQRSTLSPRLASMPGGGADQPLHFLQLLVDGIGRVAFAPSAASQRACG